MWVMSRRAFELAFATAYLFAGCRPTFLHVGEITFQKPVEVGDLLRFHSTVLHTSENRSEQVRLCSHTYMNCWFYLHDLFPREQVTSDQKCLTAKARNLKVHVPARFCVACLINWLACRVLCMLRWLLW